ncbi:MAG: Fe-S-containing hydro-lyase [Victivallaceae bacterium]|nr:Fe-S-containing hydro-lyase [Victivallaceae bacterium]
MDAIKISAPTDRATMKKLRAGDRVLLSGVIYTGRDAAHRRMVAALDAGEPLPVELENQIIYFVGPCPAPPGRPVGSAGPTTSYRMDSYSPRLLRDAGLLGMIGKGDRSDQVIAAMQEVDAVYFAATGGAGALIAERIKKCDTIAYSDLGPEAIFRMEVEDFPLVVAIDADGNDLYRR